MPLHLGQSGVLLTFGARKVFTKLKQVFTEALLLNHFDLECYIQIENASGYAIGGIFSQLISDNLYQWHPVTFFSQKMISAEI